jgi:hypothetical protein
LFSDQEKSDGIKISELRFQDPWGIDVFKSSIIPQLLARVLGLGLLALLLQF